MQSRDGDNAVVQLRCCRLTLTLYCTWSFKAAEVEKAANTMLEQRGDRAASGSAVRVRVIGVVYMGSPLAPQTTLQTIRTTMRQATVALDAHVYTELRLVRGVPLDVHFLRNEAQRCVKLDRIPGEEEGAPSRRSSQASGRELRGSMPSIGGSTLSSDSDMNDLTGLSGIEREVALCAERGMRLVALDDQPVEGYMVGWGEEKVHSAEDAALAAAHALTPPNLRPQQDRLVTMDAALDRLRRNEVKRIGLRHDANASRGEAEAQETRHGLEMDERFRRAFFPEASGSIELSNVETGDHVKFEELLSRDGYKTTTPYFLYAHAVEARGLLALDWTFSSDPYVRISCGRYRSKTPTVWQTLSPRFRYLVGLAMPHQNLVMKFALFDEDAQSGDDPLGAVIVDLSRLSVNVVSDEWYPLQGGRGELRIQFLLRRLFQVTAALSVPVWQELIESPAHRHPTSPASSKDRRGAADRAVLGAESEEGCRVEYVAQRDIFEELVFVGDDDGENTNGRPSGGGVDGPGAMPGLTRTEATWGMMANVLEDELDLDARRREEVAALIAGAEEVLSVSVPREAIRRSSQCTSTCEFFFLSLMVPSHRLGESTHFLEDDAVAIALEVFRPLFSDAHASEQAPVHGERGPTGALPPSLVAEAGIFGMGCETAWLWGSSSTHLDAASLVTLSEIHANVLELKRISRDALHDDSSIQESRRLFDVSTVTAATVYPYQKRQFHQFLQLSVNAEGVAGIGRTGADFLGALRARVAHRASILGNKTSITEEGRVLAAGPCLEVENLSVATDPQREAPVLFPGAATVTVSGCDKYRSLLSHSSLAAQGEEHNIWNVVRGANNAMPHFALYLRIRGVVYFLRCKDRFGYLQMWARLRLICGFRGGQEQLLGTGYRIPAPFTAPPFDLPVSAHGVASLAKVDVMSGRGRKVPLGSSSPLAPSRRLSSTSNRSVWTDVDVDIDGDRGTLQLTDPGTGAQDTVLLSEVEALGVSDAPGAIMAYKMSLRVKWANLEDLFQCVAALQVAKSRTPVTARTAKPFLVLTVILGKNIQEGLSDRYKSPELPVPVVLPVQRGFRPFWNWEATIGLPVDLREHASLLVTAFYKKDHGRGKGSRAVYLGEHRMPLGSLSATPNIFQPKTIHFRRIGRKVTLTVHRCGGLIAADRNGKSDPYLRLFGFDAEQQRIKDVQCTSDRISKTLDPVFEQTFVLDPMHGTVSKSEMRSTDKFSVGSRVGMSYGFGDVAGFEVVIYDHDTGFSDDLLGSCVVSLQSILGGGAFTNKRIPLLFGPRQKAMPSPGATPGWIEVSARVQLIEDLDEALRHADDIGHRRSSRTLLRQLRSSGSSGRDSQARGFDEAGHAEAHLSFRMVKLDVESTWWPASTVSDESGAARSAEDGSPWEPRFGAALSHDHLVLDPAMVSVRVAESQETAAQVQASQRRRNEARRNDVNVLALARELEGDGGSADNGDRVTIEVLENERYSPFLLDWGSRYPGHLLVNDPRRFTNEAGKQPIPVSHLDELPAPMGYDWDGPWQLDMPEEHEWSYGFDFWLLHNNFSNGKYVKKSSDGHVRCRRWIRHLRAGALDGGHGDGAHDGATEDTVRSLADFLSGSLESFAHLEHHGAVRFHIYENEVRPGDYLDWEPADPPYTDKGGQQSLQEMDDIPSLPGYHWEGPWALDSSKQEEDTWIYPELKDFDDEHSTSSSDIDGCQFRRRAWTRLLQPGESGAGDAEDTGPTAPVRRRVRVSAGRSLAARATAKGLPLARIASIHVLSDTTLYIIAYGGPRPYAASAESSEAPSRRTSAASASEPKNAEESYTHSTHVVLGPLPAMAFGNAILDRLSNLSLTAMLVDLRFLRTQIAAGDVETPFKTSLSFVNFPKTSPAAGGTGAHAGLHLPTDDEIRQGQGEDENLHSTFRLNERELVQELRNGLTLSNDGKDLIVESAVIDRATQTLMLLQHRVELLCEAVRKLQSLCFQLAAARSDLDVESAANAIRSSQLYWNYQRGLLALGRRIRRLVGFALEVQSLEIAVPWIERLLNALPGRTEPQLHRVIADLLGSRGNAMASPLSLQARGRKSFFDFTPLTAESESEATMRALLQASRIAYSLQREKAAFERDLERNAAEATVALQTKGALMDMDEIVNNLIFNLIFKRGMALTVRQMLAHDVSTPNPVVPVDVMSSVPKDSEAALLAALMYLFPIAASGNDFEDITCTFSATRFSYLGRVIMRQLQAYNATDAGIKTRAGYAGLDLSSVGIAPGAAEAKAKAKAKAKADAAAGRGTGGGRGIFDMHKSEKKLSIVPPRLHFSVMEREVLGTTALNALDSRQECLDFAHFLMDDTRERLTQVCLYWSTMTPRFVAPLVETILQTYMLAVNSVLSAFVYDDKFEPLNYGNLSAFMKFIRHEFSNAERVLSQAFSSHPGIWGIVPKPNYQSCLDLEHVTAWYQKCLLDCMRDLQNVVLRQTVDREMKQRVADAEAAAVPNDASAGATPIGGFTTGSASLKTVVTAAYGRGWSRDQVDRLRFLLESDGAALRAYPGTGNQPIVAGQAVPWRWETIEASTPGRRNPEVRSEMPENLEYALNTYHQLVESIFGDDETMRYIIMQTHAQTAASLARSWNACITQLPMKHDGNLRFFCAVANDCLRYITHLEDRLEYLPEAQTRGYERVVDAVAGASELFLSVAMKCVRRIALHIFVDLELYAAENQLTFTKGWRLRAEGDTASPAPVASPDEGLVRLFVGTVEDYLGDLGNGPLHERFVERVLRALLELVCRRYLVDMRAFCDAMDAAERVRHASDQAKEEDRAANAPASPPTKRRSSWKGNPGARRRGSGARKGEVEPYLQRDLAMLDAICASGDLLGVRTPPELLKKSYQPLRDLLELVSAAPEALPALATRIALASPRHAESTARFVFHALTLRPDVQDVSVHLVRAALLAAVASGDRSPPSALDDMDKPLTDVEDFVSPVLEYARPERCNVATAIAGRPPEVGLPIGTMNVDVAPAVECAFSFTYLGEVRRRWAGNQSAGGRLRSHAEAEHDDGRLLLSVTVHSATGLPKAERGRMSLSKAAVFVELALQADSGSGQRRTKTKKSDFPVFEQAFTFSLASLVGASLAVTAMDDRVFRRDRDLSQGLVELSTLRVSEHGEELHTDRRDVDMRPSGIVTITISARRLEAAADTERS